MNPKVVNPSSPVCVEGLHLEVRHWLFSEGLTLKGCFLAGSVCIKIDCSDKVRPARKVQ